MKSSKSIIVLLIFSFLTALFIFNGCGKKEEDIIKVGVILPLTGSSVDAANQIKNGVDLAKLEFLNQYPNIDLELVYGDSKNQAKDGLAEYNKMKNLEKIKYFIASNSGVVAPLVETIKNDKEVILMSTVNSAAGIPQTGENIYRIFVSVENEARTMADFIVNDLKLNNISVLFINDDFGLSGKNVFSQKLTGYNKDILWESSFEKNGKEFSTTIFKIPRETEVVYVIGYETAFGLIIKQLREFGYKNKIVTTIGLSVPSWRAIAGKAAEGAYYTAANYSINKPTPENEIFINKFKSKYGIAPSSFSAFGFDAASILFKSIKLSLEMKKSFSEIINEMDYVGTMGKVYFDEYGEADLPLSIYHIQNETEVKIK